MCAELPIDEWEQVRAAFSASPIVHATIGVHRGAAEEARRVVSRFQAMGSSADLQEQSAYQCANARLLLAEGDAAQAFAVAEQAFAEHANLGFAAETVKEAIVVAGEAALELGDPARLEDLLALIEALPLGQRSAFLRAHVSRFRARLASRDEPAVAEQLFDEAVALFREIGMVFYLAVVLLERAELLMAIGRPDECEPLAVEAHAIFEGLRAVPWLERVDALAVGAPAAA